MFEHHSKSLTVFVLNRRKDRKKLFLRPWEEPSTRLSQLLSLSRFSFFPRAHFSPFPLFFSLLKFRPWHGLAEKNCGSSPDNNYWINWYNWHMGAIGRGPCHVSKSFNNLLLHNCWQFFTGSLFSMLHFTLFAYWMSFRVITAWKQQGMSPLLLLPSQTRNWTHRHPGE